MWWKMLIPVDISVVNALAQFARVDWGLPAWRVHPDAAILRIPQYQGNRLGQMMLIQLVLPRSETFEGTGDRAESWLAHRGGRQGDDERDYAEREAGVDGGGLGSQIVDHVLPILADTVFVVQRLAVEDDPRPVRAVGGIVILRTYSTDDPGRADFHAIRLWGCQGIRVGPDDWNATEHRRQCGAEGFVENTAEFHLLSKTTRGPSGR